MYGFQVSLLVNVFYVKVWKSNHIRHPFQAKIAYIYNLQFIKLCSFVTNGVLVCALNSPWAIR